MSLTAIPPLHNHTLLNRHEAKARLRHLTPGCEEHFKVQAALLKRMGIVEIALPSLSYKIDTSPKDRLLGGFGSSEHVAIGEAVKLKGLPENTPLLIKGVCRIHFHHIVALAGDFYGVAGNDKVEGAISLPGGDDKAKTDRFLAAFATLDGGPPDQIRKIIVEIDEECAAVRNSSLPHHCYSTQMMKKNNAIKKIKKDIDELLADNSDHFSTNAQDAYRIGHTYALKIAQEAGQKGDLEGLKRAYALDGFACHFLTDLFASGHIRNQRGDLETFLINQLHISATWAKKLAGILTGAQHEKDGNEGLNVANKKGEQWRAYGDGHFFAPKNSTNKDQAIAATQTSVDEIYNAYKNPTSSVVSAIDALIPYATESNPLPLYTIKGNSLFLYVGSNEEEITTQGHYLQKGLSLALNYLPQNYINGFIDGYINPKQIQLPSIIQKVILPQAERITGSVWRMIGIATYHRVSQLHQELGEKMSEMADVVKVAHNNTEEILTQIKQVQTQVLSISWENFIKEIKESISQIEDCLHQQKFFKGALTPDELQSAEKKVWEAYIKLSRVFSSPTSTASASPELLPAYANYLKSQTQKDSQEIKLSVTLWFRQILDYQVQAFWMYGFFYIKRTNDAATVRMKITGFDELLQKQIEANKDHIDMGLIYEKASYITLQLEKTKTTNQWLKTLGGEV